MVSMGGAGDVYDYGRRLLKRVGWEVHLGGERRERIIWVKSGVVTC
jgi:hypothetical protein